MPHIFGTVFNPATGCFVAFNADTGAALSEHRTQELAFAACRRYERTQFRRYMPYPLAEPKHRIV